MENKIRNKKDVNDTSLVVQDKALVQDKECEKVVLGCLMEFQDALHNNDLTPECFYDQTNSIIYEVITDLVDEGKTPDVINVCASNKIKQSGITPLDITECVEKAMTMVTFNEHQNRLIHLATQRKLWMIGQELVRVGTMETDNVLDIKQRAVENLKSVGEGPQSGVISFKDALSDLTQIVKDNINGVGVKGIPTGFRFLDEKGGLRATDLVLICASSSQGKTALALDFAMSSATNGYPVAFYSTEMLSTQLASRLVSQVTIMYGGHFSSSHLTMKPLDSKELEGYHNTIEEIQNLPIYFDDNSTSSLNRIIASIRGMVRKRGVKVSFVDYLQVLQCNEKVQNEEQFFGVSARRLKNLAKELKITIVLLSQLSRDRNTTEPSISRIRGSGQIFEACDNCILIYRPEEYGENYSGEYSNVDPDGTALIKLAKGRNIGTGSFICGFDSHSTHFFDFRDGQDAPIIGDERWQKRQSWERDRQRNCSKSTIREIDEFHPF